MSLNVTIKQQAQVKKFFEKLGINSEVATDNVLRNVADIILKRAMGELAAGFKGPAGEDGGAYDTGTLASGFEVKDEPMRKVVGNNVSYAAHMEFGTGPGAGKKKYMPPSEMGTPLESWSTSKGYDADGLAQTIYNRGTLPRRYLGRAVQAKKGEVPLQFAKELAKQIEKSIGQKVAVRKR